MPMPRGTRFRYKKGTNIRLAFAPGAPKKGATPVEAENMQTGAIHTAEEFRADKAKRQARRTAGQFRSRRSPKQIHAALGRGKDYRV